ncbi:MAG: sugar ABC transporter permease [Clostridia bacterium]|nr:sugar ABC transporter permease [Clostridia bacterium]
MQRSFRRRRFNLKPYLFVLPILVFAVWFVFYPFLRTILSSVSLVNASGEILSYVGLDNFRYMLEKREFKAAFANTVTLTAVNVPVTVVISLLLAVLATKKRPLSPVYETLFSLPMALSMATISLIFRLMFSPNVGIINRLLGTDLGWFEDESTAMGTMLILTVWMGVSFNYLLFLSAFRGIPADRIGASQVDGANAIQTLIHVRIPAIMPTIVYVVATNAILAIMTSGPVMIITKGGPNRATSTLIYMMYTSGYASSNDSLAACVSLVAFLLAFTFTFLTLFLDRKKVKAG